MKGGGHEHISLHSRDGGRYVLDSYASADADSREDTKSFCKSIFILLTLCLLDGNDVSGGVSCIGSRHRGSSGRRCGDPFGTERERIDDRGRRRKCYRVSCFSYIGTLNNYKKAIIAQKESNI